MKAVFFKHRINLRFAAATCCQLRGRLVIGSLALVVATICAIGPARAAAELPSQDQALARALENHPDIVAAKAKLALAEAELYGKRMEVSRQVLGLYGGLKMLEAQIAAAKVALTLSKAEFDRTQVAVANGVVDPSTKDKAAAALQAAEAALVQSVGQREQAEKELHLLIGATPPAKEDTPHNEAALPARETPQGPIVGIWKTAAEKSITVEFIDMPLEEVLNFLSDETRIKFLLQRPALDEIGMDPGTPISLSTNEVPLRAALQAFEDAYPDLQFVLRDYGVLLTTKEYAEYDGGYLPVLEIGKEPLELSKEPASDNSR